MGDNIRSIAYRAQPTALAVPRGASQPAPAPIAVAREAALHTSPATSANGSPRVRPALAALKVEISAPSVWQRLRTLLCGACCDGATLSEPRWMHGSARRTAGPWGWPTPSPAPSSPTLATVWLSGSEAGSDDVLNRCLLAVEGSQDVEDAVEGSEGLENEKVHDRPSDGTSLTSSGPSSTSLDSLDSLVREQIRAVCG